MRPDLASTPKWASTSGMDFAKALSMTAMWPQCGQGQDQGAGAGVGAGSSADGNATTDGGVPRYYVYMFVTL